MYLRHTVFAFRIWIVTAAQFAEHFEEQPSTEAIKEYAFKRLEDGTFSVPEALISQGNHRLTALRRIEREYIEYESVS